MLLLWKKRGQLETPGCLETPKAVCPKIKTPGCLRMKRVSHLETPFFFRDSLLLKIWRCPSVSFWDGTPSRLIQSCPSVSFRAIVPSHWEEVLPPISEWDGRTALNETEGRLPMIWKDVSEWDGSIYPSETGGHLRMRRKDSSEWDRRSFRMRREGGSE